MAKREVNKESEKDACEGIGGSGDTVDETSLIVGSRLTAYAGTDIVGPGPDIEQIFLKGTLVRTEPDGADGMLAAKIVSLAVAHSGGHAVAAASRETYRENQNSYSFTQST